MEDVIDSTLNQGDLLKAALLEAGYTSRHASSITDYYSRVFKPKSTGGIEFQEFSCLSDLEKGSLSEIFVHFRLRIRNDPSIPVALDTENGNYPWRRVYVVNTLRDVSEKFLAMELNPEVVRASIQYLGKEVGLDENKCPLWTGTNKTEIGNFTKEWDTLQPTLTSQEVEDWRHNSIPIIDLLHKHPTTWGRVIPEVLSNDQLKCRVSSQTGHVYYKANPIHRYRFVLGLPTWTKTIRSVNRLMIDPTIDPKDILQKRRRAPVRAQKGKKSEKYCEDDDEDNDTELHNEPRKLQKIR